MVETGVPAGQVRCRGAGATCDQACCLAVRPWAMPPASRIGGEEILYPVLLMDLWENLEAANVASRWWVSRGCEQGVRPRGTAWARSARLATLAETF